MAMTLAERFVFEEGSVVCTAKVDLFSIHQDQWLEYVFDKHLLIRCYLEDHDYDIVEFSSGIHMQGKAGRPHAHIHYVLKYNGTGNAIYANESVRKTRYINAALKDPEHGVRAMGLKPGQISFTHVSLKFMMLDMDSIHYDVLSYPLKEGIRCNKFLYTMEEEYIVALQEYAQGIYNGQIAMHERRERHEEKMQCKKEAMLKCAKEHRGLFSNWREMAIVIDKYYLKPLPFREKPRPQDVKVNCQIIAVELGIADYVDFF